MLSRVFFCSFQDNMNLRAIFFMFGFVGINPNLVNWNKESWLSPALQLILAENDLEIIQIIVERCLVVNPVP